MAKRTGMAKCWAIKKVQYTNRIQRIHNTHTLVLWHRSYTKLWHMVVKELKSENTQTAEMSFPLQKIAKMLLIQNHLHVKEWVTVGPTVDHSRAYCCHSWETVTTVAVNHIPFMTYRHRPFVCQSSRLTSQWALLTCQSGRLACPSTRPTRHVTGV